MDEVIGGAIEDDPKTPPKPRRKNVRGPSLVGDAAELGWLEGEQEGAIGGDVAGERRPHPHGPAKEPVMTLRGLPPAHGFPGGDVDVFEHTEAKKHSEPGPGRKKEVIKRYLVACPYHPDGGCDRRRNTGTTQMGEHGLKACDCHVSLLGPFLGIRQNFKKCCLGKLQKELKGN